MPYKEFSREDCVGTGKVDSNIDDSDLYTRWLEVWDWAEGVGGAAKPQTASLSTKAESLIQN